MNITLPALVGLVRAAYEAGGNGYDPYEGVDSVPLSDGDALKIAVDSIGGCEVFAWMNRAQRITAAAIPDEIAGVIEDLKGGALLSIGDELRGLDLSEAFSALVLDLLSEQLEEISDGGGVSP